MSRSKRKTPIRGITSSDSEKKDKQTAHRRIRRMVKKHLESNPLVEVLPQERELSNPWAMAKDGKMRFDPKRRTKLLRK